MYPVGTRDCEFSFSVRNVTDKNKTNPVLYVSLNAAIKEEVKFFLLFSAIKYSFIF